MQIFNYQKTNVRVCVQSDTIWFVALDCCKILQIKSWRKAIMALDTDEKGVVNGNTLGGEQTLNIISEPGLYKLIMRSRKPEARAFQRWVTHEVLPQIRQTGGYSPETTAASKLLETTARKRDALIRWELRLIMDRRGVTPEEVARLAAEAASVPGTYAGFDWQRWNVGTPSQESIERAAKALLSQTPFGYSPDTIAENSLISTCPPSPLEGEAGTAPRPLDEGGTP